MFWSLLWFMGLTCITAVEEAEQITVLRSFFEPTGDTFNECPSNVIVINFADNFSVFNEKKLIIARNLINSLVKLANKDMMWSLSCLRKHHGKKNPSFVDFVLRGCLIKKSLMKEFPGLKEITLPNSYQTLPHFFFSVENMSLNESESISTSTNDDLDSVLAWWREDTGMAEHHCNWHYLNNFVMPLKHREGDLFAYMHLQMLARYDTERIALGLARVTPFGPGFGWDKPLPVGYNPKLKGMSFRPQNMQIGPRTIFEGHVIDTDKLIRNKHNLQNALARGYLEHTNGSLVKITMDILGNTIEANKGNINRELYGNLHNDGHNIIGSIPDPLVIYDIGVGVMTHAATAPRDPVFFRWHKFIDEFFDIFRRSLEPYSADDLFLEDIEVKSIKSISYDLPVNTMKRFNHLYTFMERGRYTIYDLTLPLEESQRKPTHIYKKQLNHLPYKINITVNNAGKKNKEVVFRVFMGLKTTKLQLEQWRDMFIELDKFVATVPPGKTVFTRSDSQSSVVVQTHITMEEILHNVNHTKKHGPLIKCGWPNRLLLPRSNTRGMDFDLYVIATDWEQDQLHPELPLQDGSSLCGIEGTKIADSRPMGFPFDRKFEDTITFTEFANLVPNSASTTINIKYLEALDNSD